MVPSLNPIEAPKVICPDCGESVEAQFESMANGKVSQVFYEHYREHEGKAPCSWRVNSNMPRLVGECRSLKPQEVEKIKAARAPEPEAAVV